MSATLPNAATILSGAGATRFAITDIHSFESLGSTSEWLSSNHPSFEQQLKTDNAQLCVTDWQQAGVGRRGKVWQTLPGNITMSVLARLPKPPQALLGLSLVTGIAVSQVLEESLRISTQLKWPNDVIFDDKKLGGLLTEIMPSVQGKSRRAGGAKPSNTVGSAQTSDVVTGIGINVKRDASVSDLGIGATSIGEAGVDLSSEQRDELLGKIADRVLALHEKFVIDGWPAFAEQWASRDWLADQPVSVLRDNTTERAVARGVNEHGALLIERSGELLPLYGGNVSIRSTV